LYSEPNIIKEVSSRRTEFEEHGSGGKRMFFQEEFKRRDHLEDQVLNSKIILK
jgi:hypothetical protein